jgi:hypothetical protein
LIAAFDDQYAPPALAGLDGAHQTRGAATDDDHVTANH